MAAWLWQRLLRTPQRFGFDAAVRVLMRLRGTADPAEAAQFRTHPGMVYPSADVLRVAEPGDGGAPEVTVGMAGLTGPSGVLPRAYSEQVVQQARLRSGGMHAFFDMLGHRMVTAFASAGIKYRPARSAERAALADKPDPQRGVLLALTGDAESGAQRTHAEQDTILYYAGLFATWPRSADRLEGMLSEWLGHAVTVEPFQGSWLALPRDEQTSLPRGRLPGRFNRLGHDAVMGVRSWDPQARATLRTAPLDLATFRALLPGQRDARRLLGLARAFLGPATDFAVNPVLRRDAIPPSALGGDTRLGRDTWLQRPARRRDADDAVFPAQMMLRQQDMYQPGVGQPGMHRQGGFQQDVYRQGVYHQGVHQQGLHQHDASSQDTYPQEVDQPGGRQPGIRQQGATSA